MAVVHRQRVAATKRIQRWFVDDYPFPSMQKCNIITRYYRLQRHWKLGRDRRERLMQERTKQARNVIVAARPYWLQVRVCVYACVCVCVYVCVCVCA